ncbi:GNAT family N-acetyltransferase [Altererythrobacter aurantiacus]|uniref:GNAT family N-acetyltransferase n=1 Tax=Parapontixanthobacter aurantiacus TaxID=1463599 RepID=A0A844ZJ97_9SPHN|nr:GNAT family N-acetyltransferase [Parapontixanthobacter aurantiacus]MXO87080.1 GNAT family N-acetyltransferase [Parapontixanthobacter aurantiacus]
MNWSLRLARPEDAEAMSAIEEDAARLFAEEPSLAGGAMPPATSAEDYRTLIAKRHCLVALVADEPVGFAACRPHGRELHLHELSVRRSCQQQGIGGGLLRALIIDAVNSGFAAITLQTFRDIAWNAPFYERHGFVEVVDLKAHRRLAAGMADAERAGLPIAKRLAMIRFL